MTWNISWEGRATDFVPDLLTTLGKPGRMAQTARDAVWEAVQRAGEHDSGAWVRVSGNGWEDQEGLGHGTMTVTLAVVPEPVEVSQNIEHSQPVDLRSDTP